MTERTAPDHCAVCGVFLPLEQDVYDIRHFLDPLPPRGVACSTRCAEQAERASRLRSIVVYDLLSRGG